MNSSHYHSISWTMLAYHKSQSQDSTPMWLMPRASMEHSVPRVFCPVGNTSTSPPSFALSMRDLGPHSVIQKRCCLSVSRLGVHFRMGRGRGRRRDRERKKERKKARKTHTLLERLRSRRVCLRISWRAGSKPPPTTTERQPRIRSETREERVPTCHRIRKKTG